MDFRATLASKLEKSRKIGLSELSFLNFNNKKFHSQENLRLLCASIKNHNIIKVSLIGCQLCDKDLSHLKSSFSNIVHLDLSFNLIGSLGASTLAVVLQNNSIIQHLNLSHNRLCGLAVLKSQVCGEANLAGIEELLTASSTCENLKYLNLSSNYLGGFSTSEDACHNESTSENHQSEMYGSQVLLMISLFLRDSRSIVELNIRTNGFDDTLTNAQLLLKYITRDSNCKSLCGRSSYKPFASNLTQLHPYRDYYNLNMEDIDSFSGRFLGHELSLTQKPCVLNLNGNMTVSDDFNYILKHVVYICCVLLTVLLTVLFYIYMF